jgi:hypothetical protein
MLIVNAKFFSLNVSVLIENSIFMKYIDLIVQTLIFLVIAWNLIFSYSVTDWPMAVLLPQMLLGSWQLLSAFFSVVAKTPLFKLKLRHLCLSIVYLGLLAASCTSGHLALTDITNEFLFMVPAWALGLYYYFLTWKWAVSSQRRHSSFLPHLNF